MRRNAARDVAARDSNRVDVKRDETLRIEDNAYERSILLHELVHYVQHATGKFSAVSGFCNRKSAEEMEAYKIQNMYLSRQRTGRRALYTGAIPCVEPAAMPAAAPYRNLHCSSRAL